MTKNKKAGRADGRNPAPDTKTFGENHTNNSAEAQRAHLLAALKQRRPTTLEARRQIDVLHPAACVMELRREGFPIETEWTRDVTSEGHLHRVARYELVGERAQQELFQVDG